ncbi:hypothetical protein CA267_018730 [Alteromonas pelagimontana]|uniref:Uncharacterized protein n=1 Tax=Alteromonas pelagimontana TaxID=1858656 RepID=A0A6M4MJ65_9ALTE|nr:hypothetical protein [Alteromonas pelagimontana]QJR82640.1 hypothetical protein CA267_018730 [Alteromonas pelagimontana]
MSNNRKRPEHERDITLNDDDAEAGGAEESVCGEEDPGVALEDLVTHRDEADKR